MGRENQGGRNKKSKGKKATDKERERIKQNIKKLGICKNQAPSLVLRRCRDYFNVEKRAKSFGSS